MEGGWRDRVEGRWKEGGGMVGKVKDRKREGYLCEIREVEGGMALRQTCSLIWPSPHRSL